MPAKHAISTITNISNPWRDALLQASFRRAFFHVEANSKESGRRIVVHEFPKKDVPFAEDMGRKAKAFTIRAYCIAYPFDMPLNNGSLLYVRDYRLPRDLLLEALETSGPGVLQLPSLRPEYVVVNRYRLSEEEKFGGYCTFDIDFVEFGMPPQYLTPSINTANYLDNTANILREQIRLGKAGPQPPKVTKP